MAFKFDILNNERCAFKKFEIANLEFFNIYSIKKHKKKFYPLTQPPCVYRSFISISISGFKLSRMSAMGVRRLWTYFRKQVLWASGIFLL